MRSLRRPWLAILPVLLLLAAALPLGGCCGAGDPELVLRSPIRTQATPIPQAQGYAIEVPAARRYEALREYSAPAPAYRYEPLPASRARAVGPCADPGTAPYSPPPLPGDDDVPESIPAFRR